MRRLLAATVLAAAALVPAAHAAPPVSLGGQCDGIVDTMCRRYPCGEDELDCGLIPPCFLWVAGYCLL